MIRIKTVGMVSSFVAVLMLLFGLWLGPRWVAWLQNSEAQSALAQARVARSVVAAYPGQVALRDANWAILARRYDFARGRDANWENVHAPAPTLSELGIVTLCVSDQTGRLRSVWVERNAPLPASVARQIQTGALQDGARGVYLRAGDELWTLCALPIRRDQKRIGTIWIGHRANHDELKQLLRAAETTTNFWFVEDAPVAVALWAGRSRDDIAAWPLENGGARAYAKVGGVSENSVPQTGGAPAPNSAANANGTANNNGAANNGAANNNGAPAPNDAPNANGVPVLALLAQSPPAPARALLRLLPWVLSVATFLIVLLIVTPGELATARLARFKAHLDAVQRDGETRPLKIAGADLVGLGANLNTAMTALDETARRGRQRERLHRQVTQIALDSGDVFWVREVGSSVLEWHGDVETLLGYETGALEPTLAAWLGHVHAADRERVAKLCARQPTPRETLEAEFRVVQRGGSERVWKLRARALQSEAANDEAPRMLAVCFDVTARRRDEEDLRSSRERLERIFETAADAIVITDARGQISFANAAAEAMFGLNRAELRARSMSDGSWVLTDLDGAPFEREQLPFARVRAARAPLYEFEFAFARPGGQRVLASLNAAPLLDERGKFSGVVASVSDITERRALQDRLYYQAFHDPLTHLANRALVRQRLDHALEKRDLAPQGLAVIFIDLDNFKFVNDSLGHAAGDQLLVSIAERLRACLRVQDTAARFGGDEFVILLEDLETPRYAVAVAERVLESLRAPFALGQREVFSTPSIGIAFGGAGAQTEEILRHADAAMYEAKARGKACFAVYEASMSAAALKRLELENDLRRALQKGEFALGFQPKWDLKTDQVAGFEALVRWNHPRRGEVAPQEFIALAEETGLIVPLGFQVLGAACEQIQGWNAGRARPLCVAVNVSARQLLLPEMVELVADALEQSGLASELLTLEITESAISLRSQAILQTLGKLKELGVKLAIDDFGTGYSSLAYLRAFPFDFLKIDRQFVAGVERQSSNGAIITSMVTLAHALEMRVVAEGAETGAEVERLRALGCDWVQGFHFGAPQSAAQTERSFGWEASQSAVVMPVESVEVAPQVVPSAR